MTARAVSVLSIMTPFPVHVAADASLVAAASIMKGHEVRHLPVVRDGQVIGVVRSQDLEIATSLTASMELPVERLCINEPLLLETDEPIASVVQRMTRSGHDAAVVLRRGRLAGLVTATDICQFLWRMPGVPTLEPPLRPVEPPPPFVPIPPGDGAA